MVAQGPSPPPRNALPSPRRLRRSTFSLSGGKACGTVCASTNTADDAPVTTEPRRFARALRHRQTSAEDVLWQLLRGRRLASSKWRRQVTLGPYTADFLCLAAKLVVEVDGRQHAEVPLYDAARSREIEAQGFVVLRFTNTQVRERLDDVVARITQALREASGD